MCNQGLTGRRVPADPLISRVHEITQVYGTTIKASIHEMLGDGIMSAIDFEQASRSISSNSGSGHNAAVSVHFFGFFGLLAAGAGTLMASLLILKKLVLHQAVTLQNGPLLFACTIFILAGTQLICLGLVSELLARTYYESQGKPIYVMWSIKSQDLEADLGAGRHPQVVRQ